MTIPIQRVTATSAVVNSLKERICGGEFGPGDQLPSEQTLLKEYAVSRLTLREALAMLNALGIIQVRHGKGAFVNSEVSLAALNDILIPMFPQHDHRRMKDLIEARNLIEAEMAASAALKRDQKQIRALEALLEYDEEILHDPQLFADRDYAFHLTIAEMCSNRFFMTMYQALYRQIQAFLLQYARSIEDPRAALDRHRPILDAIIRQDAEAARQLAREHASICAAHIKEVGQRLAGCTEP